MCSKTYKHTLPSCSSSSIAGEGATRPNTNPGLASITTRTLVLLSAYYLASVNSTTTSTSYITDTRTTSAIYTYVPDDDSSSGSSSSHGTCVADDDVCEADPDCTACLSLSSRQGDSGQPCETRYPEFLHSNASICEQVAASYCCYYEDESTAETCLANVPTADYWNCILTNMGMNCVIEDMPCYGSGLLVVEPQTPAPFTRSTSAINETPLPTTLHPSTTAIVETPSSSTTAIVETPNPSTTAIMETPSPSTTAIVETPNPSTTAIVETPSPSTAAIVETPNPSTTAIVETPTPSISDRELPSVSPSTTVEPTNFPGESLAASSTYSAAPIVTQSPAPIVEATTSTMSSLGESLDADNIATGANGVSTLVAGTDAPWKLVGFAWLLGICLVTVMY